MHGACGRPGCDEAASATFGFDGGRMVVWLHPLDEPEGAGRLCARHADALVVPRGWTLHDRRKAARRRAAAARAGAPARPHPVRREKPVRAAATAPTLTLPFPERPGRTMRPPVWAKRVDPDDPMGALLDAGSPLLARAFRNARTP